MNSQAINLAVQAIHDDNVKAGWWPESEKSNPLSVPAKLALIHSEVSEAMEGYRKNLPDDKLPHRSMFEVELADAVIRIFDLAGSQGIELGTIMQEKIEFNKHREDHKPEARAAVNGKKF